MISNLKTMKTLFIIVLTVLSFDFCHGQEQSSITTIILVRHAEKLDDGTNNPNLSFDGKQRALKLKSMLVHSDINAIYSTPYKRTMSTVDSIAKTIGLEIQEYNPVEKNFIQSIYHQNIGKTILVSGHSNTTPYAVNSLIGIEKYKNIDHDEYGRIFIVTITDTSKTSVLEIQY